MKIGLQTRKFVIVISVRMAPIAITMVLLGIVFFPKVMMIALAIIMVPVLACPALAIPAFIGIGLMLAEKELD